MFYSIFLELSHLDAIFLLIFLPDTCQTKASGFFLKEVAQVLTPSFFSVKVFTRLVRNFFEVSRSDSDMCFVSLLGLSDTAHANIASLFNCFLTRKRRNVES